MLRIFPLSGSQFKYRATVTWSQLGTNEGTHNAPWRNVLGTFLWFLTPLVCTESSSLWVVQFLCSEVQHIHTIIRLWLKTHFIIAPFGSGSLFVSPAYIEIVTFYQPEIIFDPVSHRAHAMFRRETCVRVSQLRFASFHFWQQSALKLWRHSQLQAPENHPTRCMATADSEFQY